MPLKGLVRSSVGRLSPNATVQEACQAMHDTTIGAVAVLDGDELQGIFTYKDLIDRVILPKREPGAVRLGEVMTRGVECISVERSPGDALRVMMDKDYTHLPVVDDKGRFVGMTTLRSLLEHQIQKLAAELDTVTGFLAADGSGGD